MPLQDPIRMPCAASPPDSLTSLVHGIHFAMLTTRRPDGSLGSRPMVALDDNGDGFLWFFTGGSTHKAADIAANPDVNLSYSDPQSLRYVSVSGRASLVTDRPLMSRLWRPAYAAWIPLGIDDPDLALLRIVIGHVEFWREPSTWIGLTLACGAPAATRDHAEGRHTS